MIETLTPSSKEFVVWDAVVQGFGVRVRPSGAKSYVVVYRAGQGRRSPVRKVTLCAIGKLTPDEARALARRTLAEVTQGKDPAAARLEERSAISVEELSRLFLENHIRAKRKTSTAENYERVLKLHVLPFVGRESVRRLSRATVASLHQRLRGKPYVANYMVAVVRSMYGFGQKRGYVPEGNNPATRIDLYREESRQRYLSTEELRHLGQAMREAAELSSRPAFGKALVANSGLAAIELLLLTGARLREILNLKWDYLDVERGLLFLPDSKTGKKTIVLNSAALSVFERIPVCGSYIFPGTSIDRPRVDLKKPWASLIKRAGLNGLRLHDLRHTHASIGAGAGLGLPIIGKLLGHSVPATTARYAHLDVDPLRKASEFIGARIAASLNSDEV